MVFEIHTKIISVFRSCPEAKHVLDLIYLKREEYKRNGGRMAQYILHENNKPL